MTTTTGNQQIVIQQLPDAANLPNAQVAEVGSFENKLFQRYTNTADRTARNATTDEGQVSSLQAEDRVEIYDTANWISLYPRSLYASVRLSADQTVTNTTVLTNVTGFSWTVVTSAIYLWRIDMFYDSSTTEDIQFAFTWPGGSTARWGGLSMMDIGASSPGVVKAATQNTSGTAITYGGSGAGTVITGALFGEIQAGANGTVQWQFSQAAAALTNTVLRRGTRMNVWRVS